MFGVFVGRMCPVHCGHEVVIRRMLDACGGAANCLAVLGSSNSPISMRHFFSYSERRDFLKALFPEVHVVGLPDYQDDCEWVLALDDLLKFAVSDPTEAVFFGGCDEDVRYFSETGRRTEILNRFDGTTPKVSATEVRDALIHGRPLDGLVNPAIADAVRTLFHSKWEKFIRM